MATDSAEEAEPAPPVVINISPMAHFAVGFFALGLLVPVLTWPLTAPLLIIPVLLSALIIRLRTQADHNGVTVRTLLGSQSVRWEEIDGLRFRRGSWARAQLKSGRELAVTRGHLRNAAAADRGQRRPSAQSVRGSKLTGLAPLSSIHSPTPAPMPTTSAANDPMNGRRAQPRPASKP